MEEMNDKGELQNTLEDLDKVETENRDLKENLEDVNKCVQKLKEQLKKFKDRHKEVTDQLKKANEDIVGLKVKWKRRKELKSV